ncbi:MAG: hypothetical protein Q4615_14240 [Paracoccus aminovorans]|nr:hypothetical protein [Paracoccus aminovorans]
MTISPALEHHLGEMQATANHAEAIACAIEDIAMRKAMDAKIIGGLATALVSLCIDLSNGLDSVNLPEGDAA